MTARVETRWPTMGGEAAIWLVGDRPRHELEAVADAARAEIDAVATALTRFDPASELCRLNADPRPVVPASPTMRRFLLAARRAGVLTHGLVDATRLPDVEAAGYTVSMAPADAGSAPAPAPASAGPRAPAGPHPDRAYRALDVGVGRVSRPPGVRLDSGGIGKGLAADLAARRVPAGVGYAISVGGDLAVGGPRSQPVDVLDAAGTVVHRLEVGTGGVATSAITRRRWTAHDGRPAHHLIDPATGSPALSGVVAPTAIGVDAVEAEALAKAALLAGPRGAAEWLRRRGGVVQTDHGRVEVVPGLAVVRLPRAGRPLPRVAA